MSSQEYLYQCIPVERVKGREVHVTYQCKSFHIHRTTLSRVFNHFHNKLRMTGIDEHLLHIYCDWDQRNNPLTDHLSP